MSPRMPRPLLVFPLLVAVVALAACDSGSDSDLTLADVAGTYEVQEFRFRPETGALAAPNLLDTLVVANTSLRVRNSGDVTFDYEFRGGEDRVLTGEAEVRGDEVRITFDGTDADRGRLLLPSDPVVFDYSDAGGLSASFETELDLSAYDPVFYRNVDDEPGRLTIRLTRRAAAP